jgi:hypothetical protein
MWRSFGALVAITCASYLGCCYGASNDFDDIVGLGEIGHDPWKQAADKMEVQKIAAQARIQREVAENLRIDQNHKNSLQSLANAHQDEVDKLNGFFTNLMKDCSIRLHAFNKAKTAVGAIESKIQQNQKQIQDSSTSIADAEKAMSDAEQKESDEQTKVDATAATVTDAKTILDDAKQAALDTAGGEDEKLALEDSRRAFLKIYAAHQELVQNVQDAQWAAKAAKAEKAQSTVVKAGAEASLQQNQELKVKASERVKQARVEPAIGGQVTMVELSETDEGCSDSSQRCRALNLQAERDELNRQADEQVDVNRVSLKTAFNTQYQAEEARHADTILALRKQLSQVSNLCQRQAWPTGVTQQMIDEAHAAKKLADEQVVASDSQLKSAEAQVQTLQGQLNAGKAAVKTAEASVTAAEQSVAQGWSTAKMDALTAANNARANAQAEVARLTQSEDAAKIQVVTATAKKTAAQNTAVAAAANPLTTSAGAASAIQDASKGGCFHGDCSGDATGPKTPLKG